MRLKHYSLSDPDYIIHYMPITTSAKKNIRKNKTRKAENRKRKDNIKSLVKRIDILVDDNKQEEAKQLLPDLYKALDKAAKKGTIKKNAASRKKSRMTKRLSKNNSA